MKKTTKILSLSIFVIVLFVSYFAVVYLTNDSAAVRHDIYFFNKRPLFDGQHGRYLTTFLLSMLNDKLPILFHLHQQDFYLIFTRFFQAFLIVLCTYFYTVSLFSFSEKNYLFKPVYLIIYPVLFLILFNKNYFFRT